MDDQRVGAAIRTVRIKRGMRQSDLAVRAGTSRATISRLERGHLDEVAVGTIRRVAKVLDIRVELIARWRAGDLDRLLNARHASLGGMVIAMFRKELPDWACDPEVSFAIYGERGVIDILAFHPGRRALLVIELKTEVVDVNETIGTLDRKRRLAARIARERGWDASTVSVWLVVSAGRTNRARVDAHRALLRAAYPTDGRGIGRWLRDPVGTVSALSFWHGDAGDPRTRAIRRVRPAARRSGLTTAR